MKLSRSAERWMPVEDLKQILEDEPEVTITSDGQPLMKITRTDVSIPTDPGDPDTPEDPNDPGEPEIPAPLPDGTLPSKIAGPLWTVMAPFSKVGTTSSPENLYIKKAELDSRYKPMFYVSGGAIQMTCTAGGVHSPNSKYARLELREMKDENWEEAAWSSTSGKHVLEATMSVKHNFVKKPELVVGQIHDADDDILQIRVVGNTLKIAGMDDKYNKVIDPNFVQGKVFSYRVEVQSGRIKVFYNNVQVFDEANSGGSWYFKVGTYTQTSPAVSGEDPDAKATVSLSSVKVTHS